MRLKVLGGLRPPWRRGVAPTGATLVEIVVALTVFLVFGAATFAVVNHNQRALQGIATILEARTSLWQGQDVIATELRPTSSRAGDLLALSDSAVSYRALVGWGISCAAPGSATLDLPPDMLASGARLTSEIGAVQRGDLAYVFDEGPSDAAGDDSWWQGVVAGVTSLARPCPASSLVDSLLDAGKPGHRVTLAAGLALSPTIRSGAPVRFARPARLALYRSSTNDWFLGWSDWNPISGSWNIIQPVAGPYLPYGRFPAPSGLVLNYRDSLGAPLPLGAPAAAVAVVGVGLRTLTRSVLHLPALPRARHPDSLTSGVALRNRS